jgi:hypothetical protein
MFKWVVLLSGWRVPRLANHESDMLKTDNTSLIRQNGRFREKLKYGHQMNGGWSRCCVVFHVHCLLGVYRRREQEDTLQAERTSRLELMHDVEELRQRIRGLESSEVSKHAAADGRQRWALIWALGNTGESEGGVSLGECEFADQNPRAGVFAGTGQVAAGSVEREEHTIGVKSLSSYWVLDRYCPACNTQAQVAEMNTLQLQLTASREEFMKLHA